jgi:dCMP deaminase
MSDWDHRFLRLAQEVSTWSKDPSTRVGAAISDERHGVVSVGYNGFPRGVEDDDRLLSSKMKYEIIIHAEENAMAYATRALDGCTLYTTMTPCTRCAAKIIQAGIKRVVCRRYDNERLRATWLFDTSIALFQEAGVEYEERQLD